MTDPTPAAAPEIPKPETKIEAKTPEILPAEIIEPENREIVLMAATVLAVAGVAFLIFRNKPAQVPAQRPQENRTVEAPQFIGFGLQ